MSLGKKYEEIAYNVNIQRGSELAKQIFDKVCDDCAKAAEKGEYHIICTQKEYRELYSENEAYYSCFIVGIKQLLAENDMALSMIGDEYGDNYAFSITFG